MAETQTVSLTSLQRLDPTSLEKNGLGKVTDFLSQLLEGIAQGKKTILLDIPFIHGENDVKNQRELYFIPTSDLPQDSLVESISVIQVASLIDEVVEWLETMYRENPSLVRASEIPLFLEPLVRNKENLSESEALTQQFYDLLEQKAAVVLQTAYQLAADQIKPDVSESEAEPEGRSEDKPEEEKNEESLISETMLELKRAQAEQEELESQGEREETSSETRSVPIPRPDYLPQDWEKTSTYERQVETYQAISVQAGFLYNQIVGNVYNIYGLPPNTLPPELEYELRQAILRELYQLSSAEISRDHSVSLRRLQLGRLLFEKIILHNPKIFTQVEVYIEQQAASQGLTIKESDPLKVWVKSGTASQIEVIRDLSSFNSSTEAPDSAAEADALHQRLETVVSSPILRQTLKQNDAEFATSMQQLGFEQVQYTNIRWLITSYIQTTGLDPQKFLNERSAEELSRLFSVKIGENVAPQFNQVVQAYWRFQLEKLQNIANTSIQPDSSLINSTETNQVSLELLTKVAAATTEFNVESYKEGYDPRLYTLASLITPAQLLDPVFVSSLRLTLKDLFGDDPVIIDRAIQVITFIQQTQKQVLAQNIVQHFSRRDLGGFYTKTSQTLSPGPNPEPEEAIATPTPNFSQMDLSQRRLLIEQLLVEQSSQDSYLLLQNYLDAELQLLGNENNLFLDPSAEMLPLSASPGGRSSFLGSFSRKARRANQRLNTLRNAKKTFSRLNNLGKSATSMRNALKLAAGGGNPLGAAAGFVVGKAAGALLGKETGEKVEQLVAIGSFAAAVSAVISAITAALGPFLIPVLAVIGAVGSGVVVAVANGINSAGGAVGSRVTQPFTTQTGVSASAPTTVAGSVESSSTAAGSLSSTSTPGLPLIGTPSVAAVATGGTVVGTICLAAVVTITTQGAFLDPARVAELTGEVSPFVEIDKEVSPNAIDNNTPTTVSYTITITPKENYIITPIPGGTTDTISYLGGDPLNLTTPIDSIRQQLGTTPINPGETRQITYSFENVSGVDVQVTNFFTLAFTVEGEDGEQTLTKSAFLRIGNPQIGCFNFVPGGSTFVNITSIDWTEAEMAKIQEAFAPLANNATYMALLCSSGPIDLYRLEGSMYGGWAPRSMNGTALGIYDLGLAYEVASTRYTLIHELGHILDYRNSHLNPGFNSARTRSGCYSYPFPADCNPAEAFAEAVSLFVVVPGYERLAEWDLLTIDPPAYDWINQNIFGGEAISR